jgi:hypothetical protein
MDIFFVGASLARLYSTLWGVAGKTNNTTNLKNILKYLLTTTLTLGLLSATNTVIATKLRSSESLHSSIYR